MAVTTETCEQVVPEGLANTLANALGKDDQQRHRRRLGRLGGLEPADVGQDRHHRVASLVGIPGLHQPVRGGELHLRRHPHPSGLCSFPLRRCGNGDLYGGKEPARTWFLAMKPIANDFGACSCRRPTRAMSTGAPGSGVPSVAGLKLDAARQRLKDAGFQVADQPTTVTEGLIAVDRGGLVGDLEAGVLEALPCGVQFQAGHARAPGRPDAPST